MTIRLRCAQCQRKLKLPDEALGKKVQCPTCGARFLAGSETAPLPAAPVPPEDAPAPPAVEQPSEVEDAAGVVLRPDAPPVVDSLFADLARHSLGAAALPLTPPGVPVFTPLDLGGPKTGSAVEPVVSIPLGEPPAPPPLEWRPAPPAVETAPPEIGLHPAEPKRDRPPVVRPRRRLPVGCLAGGLLLLLVLGGGGYAVHRWSNHGIPEEEWQTFAPPGSHLNVRLPGAPEAGPGPHHYTVVRRKEEMTFVVGYRDLPAGEATPRLDEVTSQAIDEQKRDGAAEIERRPIRVALTPGREFVLRTADGGRAVTRLFLVPVGERYRLYEATVRGPNVRADGGDAVRFLNSFFVSVPPSGSRSGPATNPGGEGKR